MAHMYIGSGCHTPLGHVDETVKISPRVVRIVTVLMVIGKILYVIREEN